MGILACSPRKKMFISNCFSEDKQRFVLKFEKENKIYPKDITLKIHACGIKNNDERIKNIFSNKINDTKDQSKGDMEFHMSRFYWIIKLYSEKLNENVFDEICKEIENDRNDLKINIRQNTILYFEDNPDEEEKKDIFLKKIEDLGYIYRPRMIFITKKKSIFKFNDNRYITNIIWNNNSEEGKKDLINQIISAIWNIDCYFNERLNESIDFSRDNADNIFKGIEKNFSDYSINIFLTGLSRAGKSSFINLMTGKLSALESTDKESVTSKLTEYFLYTDNKDEEERGAIKLIDSPGLVYNFNDEIVNEDTVLNSIKEQIKKAFEDKSINQIDIVLFFFCENSSLENAISILKILDEYKFNVIFVVNRCVNFEENGESLEINSTISFLKQNKLNNLINKNNFIPCNLKSSKKIEFYGMKEIWERIYNILNENNPSIKDDLGKKLKKYLKDFNKDKVKEEIDNENKKNKEKEKIIKDLNNNQLFKKMVKETILEKCFNMVKKCYNTIYTLVNIDISTKIENIKIIYLYEAILIFLIGKNYGFSRNSIIKNKIDEIYKILEKMEGNEINQKNLKDDNIIQENNYDREIIKNRIKNFINDEKDVIKIAEFIKEIEKKEDDTKFFSKKENIEFIGNAFKNFFEDELKKEEFIPFYLKYYNIYNNCFKYIEKLISKEVWEIYEVEYINDDSNTQNNNNIINNENINNKNK